MCASHKFGSGSGLRAGIEVEVFEDRLTNGGGPRRGPHDHGQVDHQVIGAEAQDLHALELVLTHLRRRPQQNGALGALDAI